MHRDLGRIELVVTDLDGTLWHTTDELPAGVRAAWDEVVRRVPVLVATGRRLTSTRRPLAELGLVPPAVVLNGALAVDLATGDRFHRAPFPTEQAAVVLEAFRDVDLDPCLYVDGDPGGAEVILSERPSTNPAHVEALLPTARVTDLARAAAEIPVLGFSLIGVPHGPLAAAAAVIDGTAEVHLDRSFDFPGTATITVAPRGQSKWDGVLAFCRRHDIDATRVLAVADGPNDVELLTNASVSVVPEAAHPAASELADHRIPPAAEGGWASLPDLLDRLGVG